MTQNTPDPDDTATPEAIRDLVDRFYEQVQADDLLGPIFETRLEHGWNPHLEKMYGFWETVLLGLPRYKGSPLQVHAALTDLTESHFERWLTLFARTASETLTPGAARRASMQAMGMAAGMTRRLNLEGTRA